ncbi:hypothetical protein V2I68_13625 [Pseudomonas viridiflava]|uniref:Lipoprotein n=1 Tax=Pseudomonas viridiflava TaxID=33069 RepID=A0ABU7NAE6_PSEVI|nr:hypothetical protein [Pseudomonas viridiflava]MEE4041349.1 hypothetical protein [Pseudomonas viridiflava]MEE4061589.1 hypothetical protein [Pseudomonas viridiflava]MEE4170994.1 hypothetical protein [Pseudomonas viridiflava]
MIKYLVSVLFLLNGCGEPSMNNGKPEIELALNSSIETTLTSTTVKLVKGCDSHFCNYQFSLPSTSEDLIKVKLITNNDALSLDNIHNLNIVTTPSGAITDVDIYAAGVPQDSKHEDAMSYFYRQVHNLASSGWHRYIYPDEARISGEQASKFDSKDEILGHSVSTGPWNDPELQLSKTEWNALPAINTWMLHNGDQYLYLRVQRENSNDLPQDRGSYLFTMTFKSESEFYKEFIENENREQWKELLPAELNRMAQVRKSTETQLKKMGIVIDERYENPKVSALAD